MSIYYKNKAKLFELGLSGTIVQYNFQPRMPWGPGSTNGDNYVDESGNGFDLEGTNTELSTGPHPGTYAVYFDGTSGNTLRNVGGSYISALDIAGDMTLELYLSKGELATAEEMIVMFAGNGETLATNYQYSLAFQIDNRIRWFHEFGAGSNVDVPFDYYLPVGQWSYIAVVRNDTDQELYLYVDGQLADTKSYINSAVFGATSAFFRIGANVTNATICDELSLAGLRIRNLQATPEEIQATWDRINPLSKNNIRTTEPLPQKSPSTHSSLTMWFEADQNSNDENDDVISQPTTLGIYGITQSTSANAPYIITSGGESAWKTWDDVSAEKWFETTSSLSTVINNSTPNYHAFAIVNVLGGHLTASVPSEGHRIFGDDANVWGLYSRRTPSGSFAIYGLHNDGTAKTVETVVDRYQNHLVEFWYDTVLSESVLRIDNGDEVRISAGALSSGTGSIEIGGSTGKGFHGSIGAVVFADAYEESQGIRNYFFNKFGVSE